MIEEYLYEIIGLIAILTAIVIYFLRKKSKQESEDNFVHPEHNSEINSIDTINTVQAIQENDTEISDEPFVLNEGEGSFGDIEQNPFVQNKKTKLRYRIKGEVPEHGKISKENFKEFAGVKLLIAEDNLINQKVLNGLLADSGIEITMADDGQIALDILEKDNSFNMILMDAHMPRVDGFEATRTIRANPNYEHIVIVALSGDTAADDVKRMIESGMQEHLEKPLRMDALYDILYAYTKADISSIKSEFVEVIMTKELNGDKGLETCGGDEEFYRDILDEFTQNYTNSSKKLSTLLENGDIKRADAILLDFIGVSANIGADNINKIAQSLKESIKDIEEKSYIILLNNYDKHLKILLKDIQDYKNL